MKDSSPVSTTAPAGQPPVAAEPFPFFRRLARATPWLRRLLAVGVIGGVLVHSGLNIWASLQLNRELAALRAAREPLTLAEVFGGSVAEERNAAPLYTAAGESLRLSPEHKTSLNSPRGGGEPLPSEVLAQNQRAIALLRRAAALPECSFNVDWSNPVYARLPHLLTMRRLARLMSAQVAAELAAGDVDRAIEDTGVLFRMSRHTAAEPVLISMMVARAMERTGYGSLAQVLARGRRTPQREARMRELLPSTRWPEAASRAVRTERAAGVWIFENLFNDPWSLTQVQASEGGDPRPTTPPGWTRPPRWIAGAAWAPLRKLDEALYLRYMNERIALADVSSSPERLDTYDRLPRWAIGTRMLVPAFNAVGTAVVDAEVRREQALVALELERFRSEHGRYPERLQPTELAVEAAPAAGRLQYRREGESYVLYGLGPNGRDDAGVDTGRGLDDIVWQNSGGKPGK